MNEPGIRDVQLKLAPGEIRFEFLGAPADRICKRNLRKSLAWWRGPAEGNRANAAAIKLETHRVILFLIGLRGRVDIREYNDVGRSKPWPKAVPVPVSACCDCLE